MTVLHKEEQRRGRTWPRQGLDRQGTCEVHQCVDRRGARTTKKACKAATALIKLDVEDIASAEAELNKRVATVFFKTFSIPISSRPVQDRVAFTASSIRSDARKLKADVAAALDAAKRKIEAMIIERD